MCLCCAFVFVGQPLSAPVTKRTRPVCPWHLTPDVYGTEVAVPCCHGLPWYFLNVHFKGKQRQHPSVCNS